MAGESEDVPDRRGSGPDHVGDLLRRVAGGDQKALALVYDATSAQVFGDILGIVGDHSVGQSVLQSTYLDVWRSAEDYLVGDGTAWVLDRARHAAAAASSEPRDATADPAADAAAAIVGVVTPPLTARSTLLAQIPATPQGKDAPEQAPVSPVAEPGSSRRSVSPAVDPAPTTNTLQAIQRTNWTRGLILLVAAMVVLVGLGWASVTVHELVTGAAADAGMIEIATAWADHTGAAAA